MGKMTTMGLALGLLTWLLVGPALAANATTMTLQDWRTRTETARTYMVLGALALTRDLDVACPVPVTVGELEAAMRLREDLPLQQSWPLVMMQVLTERGCGSVEAVKPNA